MQTFILSLAVFALSACGPKKTPGANPHDMSEAQHEQAAAQEDALAESHAAQFDPNAEFKDVSCGGTNPHGARRICWTSSTNPSAEHLAMAAEHQRMAADHRAASQALVAAEATACAGIAEADRDTSPFDHAEDIASVTPLTESHTAGKATTQVVVGAVVEFRAVPGMTAEWLQRAVDCHIARNASLGHVVPEMPNCPLVPNGASAKVASTGTGFSVSIRSDDPVAAADILARAQRLISSNAPK